MTMRLLLPLFATLSLSACEGSSSVKADDTAAAGDDSGTADTAGIDSDTSDTAGNDTADTSTSCEATLVSVTPVDGSLDQALDVEVSVTLS